MLVAIPRFRVQLFEPVQEFLQLGFCHTQPFNGNLYIDCRPLPIMPKEEDQFPAVVSYGRVTIPQNIRKRHGIEDGDEVVMLVIKKVEK